MTLDSRRSCRSLGLSICGGAALAVWAIHPGAHVRGQAPAAAPAPAGAAQPVGALPAAPGPQGPVPDAYGRLAFVLGLNPVDWALVNEDAATLARELAAEDAEAGRRYDEETRAILGPLVASSRAALKPDERRAAARRLFELSTRAVGRIFEKCIASASASEKSAAGMAVELDKARKIWGRFDLEVKVSDPEAFARIEAALAAATAAHGAPVAQGTPAVPPAPADVAKVAAALRPVTEYAVAHFGAAFRAPPGERLAPMPATSPTYNRIAPIPPRIPPASRVVKQVPRPRQILNMTARGVSELETPLIALGDMAFDSPLIFGEPARSIGIACSSCHNKGTTNPNFFVPGLSARPGGMDVSNSFFAPHANNGHFGHLDTPDLRGIRFTAPYGRNGRTASLREFTRNVITNEFNGVEPDPVLVDAMVAYLNEFDFLPNPNLAPDGSLSQKAPEAARRGEKIFHRSFPQMGNRACATCHVPGDHFLNRKSHDIGTVAGAEPHSLDRALNTPTLLSTKFTPPYFHDGSQPTLRAVTEWFDRKFALGLSEAETSDLTAYVEAVGDGVDAYEASPHFLAAELEEFSFFLSSYEFLKGQYKWDLIGTLFATVAQELRFHKPMLQAPEHGPVMDRLAALMDEAKAANKRGDVALTDAKVEEYRTLYARNAEMLK
jgi:cytochrome c peroxidase